MNSEKSYEEKIHRDQILNAVAMHLEGLGLYRHKEIIELELIGLPPDDLITLRFKTKEVN